MPASLVIPPASSQQVQNITKLNGMNVDVDLNLDQFCKANRIAGILVLKERAACARSTIVTGIHHKRGG